MPDRIEELLKSIHVLLAKSSTYNNTPDMVIISKREMFGILEKLNEALYDVLDQYEATTRSKEKARIELDKEAAEIIAEAKRDAEEVHAASMMYTDTMLSEVKQLIEQTSENIRHEYIEMLAAMDNRIENMNANREDITNNLQELHEHDRYTNMLKKLREDEEKAKAAKNKNSAFDDDDTEEAPAKKADVVIKVSTPGTNPGVTMSSRGKKSKNNKNKPAQTDVNKQNEQKAEAPAGSAPAVATQDNSAEAEKPPYGTAFKAEDFNLDAEYEQWKEGQEAVTTGTEKNAKEQKKGLRALFSRKDKA